MDSRLFLVVLYFAANDQTIGTFEYLVAAASIPLAIAGVMHDMRLEHQNFDRLTVEERTDIQYIGATDAA